MKNIVIACLGENPGHISHILAYYSLSKELGINPVLLVNPKCRKYIPDNHTTLNIGDNLPTSIEFTLICSPHRDNLHFIWRIKKKYKAKIIYHFHESIEKYSRYLELGYSIFYVMKKIAINWIQKKTLLVADSIILSSKKSLIMYDNNKNYRNRNRYYLPLIFEDETICTYTISNKREFFSYIGTIAIDHSYNECLDFMLWAIENDILCEIKFLIATKNRVERTDRIKSAINKGRLVVVDGKPMTNEEINQHYASSFAIWNAYARTNQSGVLPKAFMFGTSAIILKANTSEFVEHKGNVYVIDDNMNKQDLVKAIYDIAHNFDKYSRNCRETFLKMFYYRQYIEQFKQILKG